MKPENVAQVLTINEGRKAMKKGKKLLSSAETPEEKAAARAYKRVSIGTVVLVLALVVGLAILMPICMTSLQMEDGPSRMGTVQSDGQIRYTDGVHIFLPQEELEVQDYGLQPGDDVMVYFDPVTEEPTSAYPYALFEEHMNDRISIMLGYMVLMVVILLLYILVVCPLTPFGSAWFDYRKKQKKPEAEQIPLRAKIVIYAISAVIAIVICWPQISNLAEEIGQMRRIGAVQQLIQDGQDAAASAENMAQALETVDTMQITYAARDSDFDGYDIHEGDYLAIFGSALFGTDKDINVLLRSLAEKVREDGRDYITVYYGEDIQEEQAQKAADLFQKICPDAEVNLLRGGQPVYYYLISAE